MLAFSAEHPSFALSRVFAPCLLGVKHASFRAAPRSAAHSRAVVPVEIVRCSFKSGDKLSHIEGPRRANSRNHRRLGRHSTRPHPK